MKQTIVAVALLVGVAGADRLSAASYQIIDVNFGAPILVAEGTSLTRAFNLVYPGNEAILSADALFGIINPNATSDFFAYDPISFDISLEGQFFAGAQNLFGHNWTFFGGQVSLALLDDNVLEYTVTALQGDVRLDRAQLNFTTGLKAVPDGGATLILLGSSLLAIAWAGRQLVPKKKLA